MAINYRFIEYTNLRYERRIKVLLIIFFLAFFVLLVRVGWLQLIEGDKFFRLSKTSRLRLVPLPNPRGLILDMDGKVLATNVASFSVGVIPENVTDCERTLQRVKKVLPGLNLEEAKSKIKKAKNPFRPVVLKKNIDMSTVTFLLEREEQFPSVMILTQPTRKYYFSKMLAPVVGYLGEVNERELQEFSLIGVEPGDLVGKMGIEKVYNSYMQGEKGGKQVEVDAHGRTLRTISQKGPLIGNNVHLTIDVDLQRIAYEELGERTGVVLISDPYTGKIRAMVSKPSFDPNLFATGVSKDVWAKLSTDPGDPLENRAVRGEYPPASTFKIILTTAALEEGTITPETSFYCPGFYKVGNRVFKCWKEEGHGRFNLKEALIHSCDVYFYQLGLKMGVKEMMHYAELFGLGQKTGIDLHAEKKGFLPTPEWKKKTYGESWYPGDTANLSIGQGYILATPVQMLNVINAVANGGDLMQPHLMEKVTDVDGDVIFASSPEKIGEAPLSPSTLNFLHKALRGVVRKGTGWRAENEVVEIAGKTGTVEISEDENPHNWFLGYAPADDPALSIVVLVEHREEEISIAPQIAGKIFSRVFRETNTEGEIDAIHRQGD